MPRPPAAAEAVDNGDWQLLVKVTTDEGLAGWSDVRNAGLGGRGLHQRPGDEHSGLSLPEGPAGRRRPARRSERLWHKLYIGTSYYGRRGVAMHCISAIDNCLWSIRAQAAGVSLGELLGRPNCRPRDGLRLDPVPRNARGDVRRGARATSSAAFGPSSSAGACLAKTRPAMWSWSPPPARRLGPERDLMVDPGWYAAGWKGPWQPRTLDDNIAPLPEPGALPRPLDRGLHPSRAVRRLRRRAPAKPRAAGRRRATGDDLGLRAADPRRLRRCRPARPDALRRPDRRRGKSPAWPTKPASTSCRTPG